MLDTQMPSCASWFQHVADPNLATRSVWSDPTAVTEEPQTSNTVLLVRPASFDFHPEAARSNAFAASKAVEGGQAAALDEFDGLARKLDDAGITTLVLDDSTGEPDAIFPNNWVSFHADGTMALYPMATEARRRERTPERVRDFLRAKGLAVERIVDLTPHEREGRFLEGTGSLLLDRMRRRAFASLGPRTDAAAAADFDHRMGYSTHLFDAQDRSGRAIYHTNVMMSLGSQFAVLCSETVDPPQLGPLQREIRATGRTLIEVDYDQMLRFACNLIELRNFSDAPVIAMSSAALASLRSEQRRQLERFGEIVDAAVPTIEAVGGGSVRCMIADVHLPRR